ncbi:abc transporter sub-family g-like protein 3 [Dermatophagoides farinae]|uniref:Abc transporter sub-family g-like protein 3 n=1 Tax=Dermatophagoides farinae TaxID=6954 RepID=A0A9D4NMB8_DERFA|nr:abc transporter sub-family g-like protein 3 [Dermatophagoides farinae]
MTQQRQHPQQQTNELNISLVWHNLRYEASHWLHHREKVPILRCLTGSLEYHNLTGFMGPSGCGKTTFIRCLTGNMVVRSGLSSETEIYLNPVEKRKPIIGLIDRAVHEMIYGQLKVGEALRYAFLFKNRCISKHQMNEHIERIIEELMLDKKILKRRFNLCSGGEQKRIAIAQELMSLRRQPSFLFVDEPTTGLDSNSALVVMKCLRRLADNHRMSRYFTSFDKLYVLAKGGVCIYAGPPDQLRPLLKEQFGLDSSCDDHQEDELEKPPIEEYLKIACMGIESQKVQTLAHNVQKLEHDRLMPYFDQLDFLPYGVPQHFKRFLFKDFIIEFIRLFHIMFMINYKSVLAVLLTFTYLFVFISTVFNGEEIVRSKACCELPDQSNFSLSKISNFIIEDNNGDNNNGRNLTDLENCHDNLRNSAHHDSFIMHQSMTTLFISSVAMGLACFLFVPILKVFRNEHRNRWYSVGTCFWSLTLIQLIESILYVLTSTSLIYFTMDFLYLDQNQFNWTRFGHFLFFYWIEFLYMQSFGHFLLILAGDRIQIFMVLVQIFITVLFVFDGHFIILEQLGNPWAIKISNFLASRFINNGVLYAFYGLDRCDDPLTEYSVMLHKYSVDVEKIFENLKPVFRNMFILRLLTLICMWIRFSFKGKVNRMYRQSANDGVSSIVDYDQDRQTSKSSSNNRKRSKNCFKVRFTTRIKPDVETKFENFCRGKIHLAWRSLSLFGERMIRESPSIVKMTNPKLILHNLNGQFRFGTLNAVMGTSGSGKTSLLKVLNGRWKTYLSAESQIYISKYTPTRICYISQEISGHLLPGLTAKQSLIYAAKLKNIAERFYGQTFRGGKIDYEEIATNLLDELDISHTASTFVDYCSDGERKRLALALELTSLRMPNLICIDEPTSGLDSNSAAIEIRCLQKLVRRHLITLVVSIHQPNTEILQMFDQIYCLARGGVCIYSGVAEKIAENLRLVPEINLPDPCGCTVVTEELMKYSCLSNEDRIVQMLCQLSDQRILTQEITDEEFEDDVVACDDGIQLNRPRFSLTSFWFLFFRNLMYQKNYLWLETVSYIVLYIYHGYLLRFVFNPKSVHTSGCVSFDEDFNHLSTARLQEQIDLVNNTCYTILMNSFFLLIFLVQSGFALTKEFVYFFNEHRNGWYSTMSFYLVKSGYEILALIPIILVYNYIVDVFEPVRPGMYWWMVILTFLGALVIQGQSHLFALLIGSNFIVLIVVTFSNFFTWFVLSNTFNPIEEMHYGYQFVAQFSVLRFINEALFQLQYGFDRCNTGEISIVLYKMMLSRDEQGQYFYHCLRMLLFQIVFYRSIALGVLIFKCNPQQNRRTRGHRIRESFRQRQSLRSNQLDTFMPGMSACEQEFNIRTYQL